MSSDNQQFQISYSDYYKGDYYDYIIVYLSEQAFLQIPKERRGYPLREPEWRQLGIKLFKGWINYDIHIPDPYILFFRKRVGTLLKERRRLRMQEKLND